MSIAEIQSMSRDEQLLAMELLWNELGRDETLGSPEWHGDVLSARQSKVAEGSASYLTLEEVKKRFRS